MRLNLGWAKKNCGKSGLPGRRVSGLPGRRVSGLRAVAGVGRGPLGRGPAISKTPILKI